MEKEVIAYVLQLPSGNFLSRNEENGNVYPSQYLKEAYFYFDKGVAELNSKYHIVWGEPKVVPVKITVIV